MLRGGGVLIFCGLTAFCANAFAPRGASFGKMHRRSLAAALSAGAVGARVDGRALPLVYGTAWKKERTQELVAQAVRAGFRGIDTACQPKHYSEELVGAAISEVITSGLVTRDDLWLQTKFTSLSGQDPSNIPYDASQPLEAQVAESIRVSLRNLQTDRIDSLLLHSPMQTFEETLQVWRAFEVAVEAGVVKQLGISNCYSLQALQRLFDAAVVKPKVLQNRFYEKSGYDVGLRGYCAAKGVTYQTFWTLTANPEKLSSPQITNAARRLEATPQQVLFRFLLQSGHQPLTGTKSEEHMKVDLDIANLDLTAEEMAQIHDLFSG
ncbi:aldo/keto reductase [Pelagophyceae sp. CCMP2097]|nr:aldo/keto reductase [Pelagophyceae sp. CCMP2097]